MISSAGHRKNYFDFLQIWYAVLIWYVVPYVWFAELLGMDVTPFTFSYAELKMATNDFSSANKLGEGGFGVVYKVSLFS